MNKYFDFIPLNSIVIQNEIEPNIVSTTKEKKTKTNTKRYNQKELYTDNLDRNDDDDYDGV